MKFLILSLIACSVLTAELTLSPLQVYQGLVLGFYEEGGVEIQQIQGCTTTLKGSVHDLTESLEQFIKHGDKQEALKLLEMGLELLQDSIKTCYIGLNQVTKLSNDVDAVTQLAKTPKKFVAHILKDVFINQKDLAQEFKEIKKHYATKNSQQLGYHVGKTFYQVLIGVRI